MIFHEIQPKGAAWATTGATTGAGTGAGLNKASPRLAPAGAFILLTISSYRTLPGA